MPVLITGLFGWFSLFPSADTITFTEPFQQQPISISGLAIKSLLAQHSCWVGQSPYPGLIPGHAVYALPGSPVTYGPSQVGFDIWLHGKPGTLYGFCR